MIISGILASFIASFHTWLDLFLELPTTIVRPLANITVKEKQKLHLECEVSHPDKPAQWFKDDKPVTASARIRLTSEGSVHSLDIDSAELDDEAVYKVVVNGAESSAEVFVEGVYLKIVSWCLLTFFWTAM